MNSPHRPTQLGTIFGSLAAAATLALAFGPQANAADSAEAAPSTDSMYGAMQRDLGLTKAEAVDRVASEKQAATTEKSLTKKLGTDFAGAWYDAKSGRLQVAVTDAASAAAVRAQGADARQVDHSAADLKSAMTKLDAQRASAPSSVPSWFVDVESNRVVVQNRGDAAAAAAFVKKAGVKADTVVVQASAENPQPLIDVVGGNAYYIDDQFRCSVGFSVPGGFISAGHCGSPGSTTTTPSGSFSGSSFPGNDYAYVRVNSGNALIGAVNNYSGGRVAVKGSSEAAIGSSICRSGSTTGWNCGTIQARNSTVNYAEGSVSGLIRTNACAEGGDSGGSAVSGTQAQGVTSGGSGNCTSGGTTYFQPVNEILSAYGLSLITS